MSGHLIVILGIQGSGKGTQAGLLVQKFGWTLATAGDLFRDRAAIDDELGRAVKANLDSGQIMTIGQWEAVVGERLARMKPDETMIFDGLLRSPEQVAVFERIRTGHNLPQPLILALQLPRERAFERLMERRRADDAPELINRRIDWSEELMMPVLDHYRPLGQVIDINGDQAVTAVHEEIIQKLTDTGILPHA